MAQQSVDLKSKVDESIKGDETNEPQQEKDSNQDQDNKQENKETEKNENKNGGGQLESLFKNNGTNLFTNLAMTVNSSGGLFGSTKPSSGLFANLNQQEPINNGIDLTKPGPSLFGIDYKIPKSDESDGGEDAGGEDEQKPEDEEPKQIEMKYDYSTQTEQLLIVEIEKFRKNANDVLEKGTIALEKSKEKDTFYFIYRNQIQQILYTGQLFKGISDVKPLGSKQENIIIRAISRKQKTESQEDKDSIQIDTLKVMFKDKEKVDLFKDKMQNMFN
ncbi:unnamed protein product [Paramecium primaurelia]|uniref:RanBD1 domain-containing protein n=1 Tax=Paramecium primaurelia TaxID=5886 RepID=A0A8S1LAD5_PARPR|nr:unnamed protein product [Paramecium primaurelia]